MKQTFYLKQTLLKQKWSEISHRIWKVLSFFVRVFNYLVILYQAVTVLFHLSTQDCARINKSVQRGPGTT